MGAASGSGPKILDCLNLRVRCNAPVQEVD
jgi:hypothetical protein